MAKHHWRIPESDHIKLFLFDVDGTLTPSRARMDPEFAVEFRRFCDQNAVCLVTGSDYAKTVQQVPEAVLHTVLQSYCCSGNEIYRRGQLIYQDTGWSPGKQLTEFLKTAIGESLYRGGRTENHFDFRSGCLNFSIVGRGCTPEDRAQYREFDQQHQERLKLVNQITELFPTVSARVGGETGIDIGPLGSDKSQILANLPAYPNDSDTGFYRWDLSQMVFFGDATQPGGNDFPLAQWIEETHTVTGWEHTREILRTQYGKKKNTNE